MEYTSERPELKALDELESLLHHLEEELAAWRRRTQRAESEVQEVRSKGGVLAGPELILARQRVVELELENQTLRHRIRVAGERLGMVTQRLAFLEQDREDAPA